MKRRLLQMMILPLLFLASCSDDDGGKSTIIISDNQKNQTAFADDVEKGITFTATEAWRTNVDYTQTKADASTEQWVTLDPPSGDAGEVTIKVALKTNTTGKDRTATVHIISGSTTITVTISQKGLTEEGKIPEEVVPDPANVRQVTSMKYHPYGEYAEGNTAYITYDGEGRVKEYATYINGTEVYKAVHEFQENRIIATINSNDAGYMESGVITYTLENNRVVLAVVAEDEKLTESWKYNDAGYMTQYAYVVCNDYDGSNGSSGGREYGLDQSDYTWSGNIITQARTTYDVGDKDSEYLDYKFEYYEESEVELLPTSLKLGYFVEEFVINEMTLFDLTGKSLGKAVKKVTVTGTSDNEEGSGVATYRYEVDSKGYITKIYRAWKPADETEPSIDEYLLYEITYKD